MQRGLLNPKQGQGDTQYKELVHQHTKKFLAPKSDITIEHFLEKITPRSHVKSRKIKAYFTKRRERLRAQINGTNNQIRLSPSQAQDAEMQIAALNFWEEQGAAENAEGHVDTKYLKGWVAWLNGKGKPEDHDKTPWDRQRIPDKEVQAYLRSYTDARYEFAQALETLIWKASPGGRGLEGLNEHYMYYKWIVRGEWQNDEAGFMEDYAALLGPNTLTQPIPGARDINPIPDILNRWDTARIKGVVHDKKVGAWDEPEPKYGKPLGLPYVPPVTRPPQRVVESYTSSSESEDSLTSSGDPFESTAPIPQQPPVVPPVKGDVKITKEEQDLDDKLDKNIANDLQDLEWQDALDKKDSKSLDRYKQNKPDDEKISLNDSIATQAKEEAFKEAEKNWKQTDAKNAARIDQLTKQLKIMANIRDKKHDELIKTRQDMLLLQQDLEDDISGLQARLDALKTQKGPTTDAMTGMAIVKLGEENFNLENELKGKNAEMLSLEERLVAKNEELQKMMSKNTQDQDKLRSEAGARIKQLEAEQTKMRSEVEKQVNRIRKERTTAQQIAMELQTELNNAKKKITDLEGTTGKLLDEGNALLREKQTLEGEITKANAHVVGLNEELRKTKEAANNAVGALFNAAGQEIKGKEEEVRAYKEAAGEIQDQFGIYQEQAGELLGTIEDVYFEMFPEERQKDPRHNPTVLAMETEFSINDRFSNLKRMNKLANKSQDIMMQNKILKAGYAKLEQHMGLHGQHHFKGKLAIQNAKGVITQYTGAQGFPTGPSDPFYESEEAFDKHVVTPVALALMNTGATSKMNDKHTKAVAGETAKLAEYQKKIRNLDKAGKQSRAAMEKVLQGIHQMGTKLEIDSGKMADMMSTAMNKMYPNEGEGPEFELVMKIIPQIFGQLRAAMDAKLQKTSQLTGQLEGELKSVNKAVEMMDATTDSLGRGRKRREEQREDHSFTTMRPSKQRRSMTPTRLPRPVSHTQELTQTLGFDEMTAELKSAVIPTKTLSERRKLLREWKASMANMSPQSVNEDFPIFIKHWHEYKADKLKQKKMVEDPTEEFTDIMPTGLPRMETYKLRTHAEISKIPQEKFKKYQEKRTKYAMSLDKPNKDQNGYARLVGLYTTLQIDKDQFLAQREKYFATRNNPQGPVTHDSKTGTVLPEFDLYDRKTGKLIKK